MPKKSIDYSNCSIYKIEHIENESLIYVGHTTNFKQRKSTHKSSCNKETSKEYNFKLYQIIRDNGGWEMFLMIELEKHPCNDKREAAKRENELMKELKANMNKIKSFATNGERLERRRQYYEDNKEHYKEYKAQHIEQLKERSKAYYEKNKENILKNRKEDYNNNIEREKETRKKYYAKNKELLKQKAKEYRETNQQKIIEYRKEYHKKNRESLNLKSKEYRENKI